MINSLFPILVRQKKLHNFYFSREAQKALKEAQAKAGGKGPMGGGGIKKSGKK